MSGNLSSLLYLLTGALFILALRGLSSPETSRMGNVFGIMGMLLAIIVTFLSIEILINNLVFFFYCFINWWLNWFFNCLQNTNDCDATIGCRVP